MGGLWREVGAAAPFSDDVRGTDAGSGGSGASGASTDEVHDFEAVAFVDASCGPDGAGDDVSVLFDGDAIAGEAEAGDEVRELGSFAAEIAEREGLRLAIQGDGHESFRVAGERGCARVLAVSGVGGVEGGAGKLKARYERKIVSVEG